MKPLHLLLGLCAVGFVSGADIPFQVHGQAWVDVGRIMHASDSLVANAGFYDVTDLSGNGLQSVGAQFTLHADLGESWAGALGFGAHKVSNALGQGKYAFTAISLYQSFLTQSSLTYFRGEKSAPGFSVTLGSFPFKYNADAHNLGLYLLRGPVYPGLLMGGFQEFAVDTSKATMLGIRIHHAVGNFSHDLILNNEREIPPTLDWSLAYVAGYKAFGALEIGGGVNFYRLIPYKSALETPGHLKELTNYPVPLNYRLQFVELGDSLRLDSSGNTVYDTVFFTHQGIKVMGRFSLDFKRWLHAPTLGPEDFKLYGEGALIGIKNYGTVYHDRNQRVPLMIGFNIPTFRVLDRLSLEVEWYGSPYRNDLALMGNNNVVAEWTNQIHPIPSPKPVTYEDFGIDSLGNWVNAGDTINVRGTPMDKEHLATDNWKWSLFFEKTVRKHIRFIAQVANDHYRPRPIVADVIRSNGGTAEAFTSTKDWYFMFRAGYAF